MKVFDLMVIGKDFCIIAMSFINLAILTNRTAMIAICLLMAYILIFLGYLVARLFS